MSIILAFRNLGQEDFKFKHGLYSETLSQEKEEKVTSFFFFTMCMFNTLNFKQWL